MSLVEHSTEHAVERFAHICDSDTLSVVRCPHCRRRDICHVRIVDVISKLKDSGGRWQVCVEVCNEAVSLPLPPLSRKASRRRPIRTLHYRYASDTLAEDLRIDCNGTMTILNGIDIQKECDRLHCSYLILYRLPRTKLVHVRQFSAGCNSYIFCQGLTGHQPNNRLNEVLRSYLRG